MMLLTERVKYQLGDTFGKVGPTAMSVGEAHSGAGREGREGNPVVWDGTVLEAPLVSQGVTHQTHTSHQNQPFPLSWHSRQESRTIGIHPQTSCRTMAAHAVVQNSDTTQSVSSMNHAIMAWVGLKGH